MGVGAGVGTGVGMGVGAGVIPALGTGFTEGQLCDICVLHDKNGAPYYDLRGGYAQHAAQRHITNLHLSISHDGGVAAAVAIAERNV